MLRDRDQQFIAHRDEATHTWRILDSWHETLGSYSVDDDVPDDSPAIKILTEGEFIVLIREAARIGILENANLGGKESTEGVDFDIISEEHSVEIKKIEAELVQYKEQVRNLQQQNQQLVPKVQRSEGFELKEMAMNSILKLTAMADVDNLSKD